MNMATIALSLLLHLHGYFSAGTLNSYWQFQDGLPNMKHLNCFWWLVICCISFLIHIFIHHTQGGAVLYVRLYFRVAKYKTYELLLLACNVFVDRRQCGVRIEVCPTRLHMANTGNQTPALLILIQISFLIHILSITLKESIAYMCRTFVRQSGQHQKTGH